MEKITLVGYDRQGNAVTSSLDVTTVFTHGEQIQKSLIGPSGNLTPSGSLSSIKNGTVIENKEITGSVSIAAGAEVLIRNTRIIGVSNAPAGAYSLKATAGGGLSVTLDNCEIICQSGSAKSIVMTGDGNITARRTIIRGGQDNIYVNPYPSPGRITTEDLDVPHARVLIEESWLGDLVRVSGGHCDAFQVDGGGFVVIRRSKLLGFNVSLDSSVLTTTADEILDNLSNSAFIKTSNAANPVASSDIAVRDSLFNGGNYTLNIGNTPRAFVTGNRLGLVHRFGPITFSDNSGTSHGSGNVWSTTGVTSKGMSVVAGQPVPGSQLG
jgi:hypothetical protein